MQQATRQAQQPRVRRPIATIGTGTWTIGLIGCCIAYLACQGLMTRLLSRSILSSLLESAAMTSQSIEHTLEWLGVPSANVKLLDSFTSSVNQRTAFVLPASLAFLALGIRYDQQQPPPPSSPSPALTLWRLGH
jgi:hypothetical protein